MDFLIDYDLNEVLLIRRGEVRLFHFHSPYFSIGRRLKVGPPEKIRLA